MTISITSEVTTSADADTAWAALSDFDSHTQWMKDAVAIRFLDEQRRGKGVRFECDTRFGPLSTTDLITVTEWEEGRRIGVTHAGLVKGTGAFELHDLGNERRIAWNETLTLPLVFGGRLGEIFACPIMSRVWNANLRRLVAMLEGR